jgi:hypothetical protein
METSPTLPTLPRSIVRTVTPYAVGWLLVLINSRLGVLQITDEQLTPIVLSAVTVIVGAAWYAGVRVFEQYRPKLGWLLGAPGYPTVKVQDETGTYVQTAVPMVSTEYPAVPDDETEN